MKMITVTIDEDAGVTIETSGFVGVACVRATADLESDFTGAPGTGPRHRKPEYYQRAPVSTKVQE